MRLTQLFCDVDDFCQTFVPDWQKSQLGHGGKRRNRPHRMSPSEMATLLVAYHQSGYRTFKWFYLQQVQKHWQPAFMTSRCVPSQGIALVDSISLCACKNIRIPRHKAFAGVAGRGKSSTGWLYGFKLHLIVDDQGGIVSFCITPGNVDGRKPVPRLVRPLLGKLFGDRGHIPKTLAKSLAAQGAQLVTTLKKDMKQEAIDALDKLLLRKRSIIETINGQLKNIFDLGHSRHRSLPNCLSNLLACLVAYSYQGKKPALNLRDADRLPFLPTLNPN